MKDWKQIQDLVEAMQGVDGGFTSANKGVINVDGESWFVKIGTDAKTIKHADYEIKALCFLETTDFDCFPKLKSYDTGKFAIENLRGWDISQNWTKAKLDKTLECMDTLSKTKQVPDWVKGQHIPKGWQKLADCDIHLKNLNQRVSKTFSLEEVKSLAQAADFDFSPALVHSDLRGDNIAWDGEKVLFFDWAWMCLGSRELDVTSLLVSVEKSGFDIFDYRHLIDTKAALYLAGSWFYLSCIPGGRFHAPVRQSQFQSALIAFDWWQKRGEQ